MEKKQFCRGREVKKAVFHCENPCRKGDFTVAEQYFTVEQ